VATVRDSQLRHLIRPQRRLPALLAAAGLLAAGPPAAADWTLRPTGGVAGATCAVESAKEPLSDGYQSITAQIQVSRAAVTVTSPSVLDAGSGDIGLTVDRGTFVPVDHVVAQRTALFDRQHGELVEQFRRGARVEVRLRFWPTWPATGTHIVGFSLIGFTRAYAQLAECQ
jgi:hypothetical protein